jgi:hypothetical protein
MTDIPCWTGTLSPTLDELMAFDAMRAFLLNYWQSGQTDDRGLAVLIGSLDRSTWDDGCPGDPAMWRAWQEAVARIRRDPGNAAIDPLKSV